MQVTLASSPGNLSAELVLDGKTGIAPFATTVIQGSSHTISAPFQVVGRRSYQFSSWSDGGAQTHQIVVNATSKYTAAFRKG